MLKAFVDDSGSRDNKYFVIGGYIANSASPSGFSIKREGKWVLENEGAAPDTDVENWPRDAIAGHDAQLERAVQ